MVLEGGGISGFGPVSASHVDCEAAWLHLAVSERGTRRGGLRPRKLGECVRASRQWREARAFLTDSVPPPTKRVQSCPRVDRAGMWRQGRWLRRAQHGWSGAGSGCSRGGRRGHRGKGGATAPR